MTASIKVRIGLGLGTQTELHDDRFGHLVDELERLAFDSLWLSERIGSAAPDPLVAMSYGAGRTRNLKFGTSVMVLPGRNPVVLAKSLATLSTLSGGRVLPAFGLGAVHPREQQSFGVERTERAAWFDEALTVMRQCWTGQPFTHHGDRFTYDEVFVQPAPKRLDVWLGGNAPSALRRVGRLADGWLPSFVTPADVEAGRVAIEQTASEHDRSIEPDHYGVLIPYGQITDGYRALLSQRRPDIDISSLIPSDWTALTTLIRQFVDVGTTKFVVLPMAEPATAEEWTEHLEAAAEALLPLEAQLSS